MAGKLMALGPFTYLDYSKKAKRVIAKFQPPLGVVIDRTIVKLDPERIMKIFKNNFNEFYVIYETENVEFYRKYLAKEVKGEEIKELVFDHYECNGQVIDADTAFEMKMADGYVHCPKSEEPAERVIDYKIVSKDIDMSEVIFSEQTISQQTTNKPNEISNNKENNSKTESKGEIEKVVKELEKEGIKVNVEREKDKVKVKAAKYLDKALFNKYIEILKRNGFRFDPETKTWYKQLA